MWDPHVAGWQPPASIVAPLSASDFPDGASGLSEDASFAALLEPAASPGDASEPLDWPLTPFAPDEVAPAESVVAPASVTKYGKPVEGVALQAEPIDAPITNQTARRNATECLRPTLVDLVASFGSNFWMRLRASSHLVLACLATFVALEWMAMRLYPGGTWWDSTTRGATFWQNYICDLGSEVAGNGMPNRVGATLGKAAILVMVAAFAPFWWIVPRLFERLRRLGRLVRVLGLASLAGITAVALMPSSRFGWLHGVAVMVAGAPGLSAALLAVVGQSRVEAPPRIAAALGGSMLIFALADFVLYTRTMIHGGPGPLVLPVAQKLALLLLLAWMMVVAWKAPRG